MDVSELTPGDIEAMYDNVLDRRGDWIVDLDTLRDLATSALGA